MDVVKKTYNNTRSRNINPEKQIERELLHKLVLKIISWKDAELFSSQTEKISKKEWRDYYANTLKINVIRGREKTLLKLVEIREIIKKNGGFA